MEQTDRQTDGRLSAWLNVPLSQAGAEEHNKRSSAGRTLASNALDRTAYKSYTIILANRVRRSKANSGVRSGQNTDVSRSPTAGLNVFIACGKAGIPWPDTDTDILADFPIQLATSRTRTTVIAVLSDTRAFPCEDVRCRCAPVHV